MGENDASKARQEKEINHLKKLANPALSTFLTEVPQRLGDFFKSSWKKPEEAEEGNSSSEVGRSPRKELRCSSDWEVNLNKQLQIWRENPHWEDQPPEVKVSVPKGSLCNLHVKFNVGLPPDAVYNIVIDPDNKRVFKNIKEVISRKVLVDEGSRQVVELEQAAIWRFLWWSGTITVHVLVDQNREDYSMRFKQVKAGFMEKFEGSWKVEPVFVDEEICSPLKPTTFSDYYSCTRGKGRVGSRVSLEQLLQPAIVPPPPISWYLRGITSRTTEMLIGDLIAEAARIKGVSDTVSLSGEDGLHQNNNEAKMENASDIKERWASRRRNGRIVRKK